MARHGFKLVRAFSLAAVAGSFALLTSCATYAHTTTVVRHPAAAQAEEADRQADEFIGTPIMGDYDDDENLDFVLEVKDGDKVFKLDVHETAGGGNRELLENVRQRVNSMEDVGNIRVVGYYNPEYRGASKEYGFLDLKMIAFYDEGTGKEEAYFTDPQDSPYYTDSDVTVIYAPGHHYSCVYYPRYVSPWWDSDGDGIPNRYDPWPLSYDTWYDYNMNYIPDWYDPYYVGYYPYWSYWDMNFWVGYSWYSPGYFYRGYSNALYYRDYRKYTRLYDHRYVNNRDNSHRRLERMDAKSERIWRDAYNQDSSRRKRTAGASEGTRTYRGYETRPVDNRVLSDPSLRSRTRTTGRNDALTSTTIGGDDPVPFTRNREIGNNPTSTSRNRDGRVTTSNGKVRTGNSTATGGRTRDRASISSRTTNSNTRERSTTNRVYRPSDSRSREITSGRTTTSSSSNPVYRPSSRSRTTTHPSATSSSSRSRSHSRPAARSSSSRSRSSSQPAARSSSSRSRSSSSSRPATRSSSSSRSRSSSSARSSSGSRSRSSSSHGSSSSSSRNRHK